ncbi:MAG: hypothetical protein RQ754_03340 [Desulfuromonadales bacterium]|nr:hypothetical protein [Desulfuromonadales bacterium]
MIIGFAGKAASGKTTAANRMKEVATAATHVIPMAKVLRDEVEAFLRNSGAGEYIPLVYGCQQDKVRTFYIDEQRALSQCEKWMEFVADHSDIQDRPGLTAVTVRRLLQWWGTEYRRAQDPDYWTKAWAAKVGQYDLEREHVLIDDVRFINELETIKQQGGLIYKIERPGFDGANNHASETSLDDYRFWDGILRNDGTLQEFYRKVEVLAAQQLEG